MLGARNASDVAAGYSASQGQTPGVSAESLVPWGSWVSHLLRDVLPVLECHPYLDSDPRCHNRIHPSSTPVCVVDSFLAHGQLGP